MTTRANFRAWLRLLLVSTLLLSAGRIPAAEVSGLFEAVVPVANQGPAERQRAMREGFRQVLVKVAGQRSVLALPVIQQELGKAESLLGSFGYETQRVAEPGRAETVATRIRLKFDAAGVRAILNRGGAPVWSASRPQTYVWVVREAAPRGVYALGTLQGDLLIDAAAQRGLPLAVPAPGDLPADLPTGGIPSAVSAMAGRVGAQVVVAAAAAPASAGRVRVRGTLQVEGVAQPVDVTAADEPEALRELVAAVADQLGGRYAVVAREDQSLAVQLTVDDCNSLVAFAALERWLRSQPLVRDMGVARVESGRVEYSLLLAGDVQVLLQAMRSDGQFARAELVGEKTAPLRISAGLATP